MKVISYPITTGRRNDKTNKFYKTKCSYLNLVYDTLSRPHLGIIAKDSNDKNIALSLELAVINFILRYAESLKPLPVINQKQLNKLRICSSSDVKQFLNNAYEKARVTNYGFKREVIRGGRRVGVREYREMDRLKKVGKSDEQIRELIYTACRLERMKLDRENLEEMQKKEAALKRH